MAYEDHQGFLESLIVASTIRDKVPVKDTTTADTVVLAATNADRPLGLTGASAARAERNTIYEEGNVVKAFAATAVAYADEVCVGSDNGGLHPVVGASFFAASGHWAVGIARSAAAAGESFSLYFKPRKAT